MLLGAGREKKEDQIDSSAGIYLHKKIGDPVEKDEIVANFYTDKKEAIDPVIDMFGLAVSYTNQVLEPRRMILAKVDKKGAILCT
jgi:pyrimidine-nucleoside phosphorylase